MQSSTSRRGQCNAPFLEKTYSLLQNPELHQIISWDTEGTMILIHNMEELSRILPHYFKHKKIESFVRQLNIYNFKKVKRSIATNAFRHPCFLRQDFSKLRQIKRRAKSSAQKKRSCVSVGDQSNESSEGRVSEDENSEKENVEISVKEKDSQTREVEMDQIDYLIHEGLFTVSNCCYNWEDVFA